MKASCFNCGNSYQPGDEVPGYWSTIGRCPKCGWSAEEKALSEDEARYLVFLSLILRLETDGEFHGDGKYRIVPTQREMTVLQHGDQCETDGRFWRLTARNEAKNVLWLKGWQTITTGGEPMKIGPFVDAGKAVEEFDAMRKLVPNEHGRSNYMVLSMLEILEGHGKLEKYFAKSLEEKKSIREQVSRLTSAFEMEARQAILDQI